jgi:hypothetical protein
MDINIIYFLTSTVYGSLQIWCFTIQMFNLIFLIFSNKKLTK